MTEYKVAPTQNVSFVGFPVGMGPMPWFDSWGDRNVTLWCDNCKGHYTGSTVVENHKNICTPEKPWIVRLG